MTSLPIKRWPWLVVGAPRLFILTPLLIAVLLGVILTHRAYRQANAPGPAAANGPAEITQGTDGSRDFYRPVGYLRRVEMLIEDNKLHLSGEKPRAAFAVHGLDAYDREFRKLSSIERDLKILNEDLEAREKASADGIDVLPDFRGTLAATRRRILVRQYPSLVPLPFAGHIAAQTTTQISSANAWKLISDLKSITLVPSDIPDFALESLWKPQSDVVAGRVALYEHALKGGTSGGRRLLELEYGPAGVVVKAKQPSIHFYVDGQKSAEQTVTLEDGTVLGVTDQKHKLVFVCRLAAASIPTNATTGFSDLSQVPTPPSGTPERLIWEFDRARQSRKPGTLQETRFRATLELDLNASIQRELEAFIIKKDRTTDPKSHYRPASVALLNPSTGDLLALATYPTNATTVPRGMPFATKARRLKNQNLFTHPIGSCGKPFLAAAIYDCYPHLASMRLARIALGEGNEVNTTLGLAFTPSYDDTAAANFPWENKQFSLGREEFFTKSVNTYFIDLFLLSLASDSAGITRVTAVEASVPNLRNVQLNGNVLVQRPDFQGYLNRGEVFRLEQHAPVAKLAKEFDVAVRSPSRRDDPGDVYDLAPFQDAVERCSNPREALFRWGQPGLLPERVSLDFEGMQYLRADLFSYLLGGGTGRWTNVKLAEAMARLITGRRVNARLICVDDPKEPIHSAPPLVGLSPETIALMRQSLQGATSHKLGGGTAALLARTLDTWNENLKAQGLAVRCYSKTGTWHGEEKVSKGKKDLNSGTYVFYLSLLRLGGKSDGAELASIVGVVDIQDRGTSTIAVEFAEKLFTLLQKSYFASHASPVATSNARPRLPESIP